MEGIEVSPPPERSASAPATGGRRLVAVWDRIATAVSTNRIKRRQNNNRRSVRFRTIRVGELSRASGRRVAAGSPSSSNYGAWGNPVPFSDQEVTARREKIIVFGAGNIMCCKQCKTHLAHSDAIISKNFHGSRGRAFLVQEVLNVEDGQKVERNLITGRHIIADIKCISCGLVVGWRYLEASVPSQQYKVGKYILEKHLILEEPCGVL